MNAVAAYMASRNRRGDGGGRRSEYGGAESRMYDGGRSQQPNQYTTRNGMDDWTESNYNRGNDGAEMRRRRRKNGQFMNMDDGMDTRPENNYMRGNDGAEMRRHRGKNGRFMDGDMDDNMDEDWPEDNYGGEEGRSGGEYYPPRMPTGSLYDGGGMGFGTRDREYETRGHYGGDEERGGHGQAVHAGGTFWMMPGGKENAKLDRVTAERWVRGMRNEDNARPSGGKWTMDELKPMAQKFGIHPDPEDEKFLEFWVMTNAMYSDYCGVAKKFNIVSPEFYGLMAKAWMEDKDAMPNKTALYYENIVKKNQ